MPRHSPTRSRPSLETLESRALLSAFGPVPRSDSQTAILSTIEHRHKHSPNSKVASRIVVHNVPFAEVSGQQEELDVLEPAGPPPTGGWPVIIAIHGGGWRKFDKNEYEPQVAPLVSRGFEIVAPNYPLSKPNVPTWPVAFEAVQDAVRWARANAAEIGANPNQIAAMGESAGGHLASLLGTDPGAPVDGVSANVEAVVDFFGPENLITLFEQSPGAAGPIAQFLGGPPSAEPTQFADASPVNHVAPGDPPFLIVQGTADNLVLPSQSKELADTLTADGVPNRLILVPGAGHGFGLKVAGEDLTDRVATFLRAAMPT